MSATPLPKELITCFEYYQKSRANFVQSISELTLDSRNLNLLFHGGIVQQLKPLITDHVPSIANTAILSLARIASFSPEFAKEIADVETLRVLVYILPEQNSDFKKAATYLLRSVAKQSPKLAQQVVDAGAIEVLVSLLEVLDSEIKEAAIWGLDYIARHNSDLSQQIIDAGAIIPLLMCVEEPELSVKRIAICTCADICKHAEHLTNKIVQQDGITKIVSQLTQQDTKLKIQILAFMAQVCKYSVDLARSVVETVPNCVNYVLKMMFHDDHLIVKNASTFLRTLSQQSMDMSTLIVESKHDGIKVLISKLKHSDAMYSIIKCLGNIAQFSEEHSLQIVEKKGIESLSNLLLRQNKEEEYIIESVAETLSKIGKHSPLLCLQVAKQDCLTLLLDIYLQNINSSLEKSIATLIEQCNELQYLRPLLQDQLMTNESMAQLILKQIHTVLTQDNKAKKQFTQSRGLQYLQQCLLNDRLSVGCREWIQLINSCFPQDAVHFYTPHYSQTLLQSIQ